MRVVNDMFGNPVIEGDFVCSIEALEFPNGNSKIHITPVKYSSIDYMLYTILPNGTKINLSKHRQGFWLKGCKQIAETCQ